MYPENLCVRSQKLSSWQRDVCKKKWRRGSKSNKNKKEKHLTTHKHNEKPGNYVLHWVGWGYPKNWCGLFCSLVFPKNQLAHLSTYLYKTTPLSLPPPTTTTFDTKNNSSNKGKHVEYKQRKTISPLYFGGLGGWLDWLCSLLHSKPIIVVSVEGFQDFFR